MRKFFGVGLAVLVNAVLVAVFSWSSLPPAPAGEVSVSEVTDGVGVLAAARAN